MYLLRSNFYNNVSRITISYKQDARSISNKKPILYGDEIAPPVRFNLITASHLNIDVQFHKIDLFKGENKTHAYKKVNPLEKVPAMEINGDIIRDSHAISQYLCRLNNKNDLYPGDSKLLAKIDEMMYYNACMLFPTDSAIFTHFFAGKWPANKELVQKWYSALDYLQFILGNQKFLTGDKVRLCDICCATTLCTLEILVPSLERHEKIRDWLERLKSLSCFEINARGLKRLDELVSMMKKQVTLNPE